jgi:hypothetical protein
MLQIDAKMHAFRCEKLTKMLGLLTNRLSPGGVPFLPLEAG